MTMDILQLTFPLKEFFTRIFKEDIYLVGGAIRDFLLYGNEVEACDVDLVVVNHTVEDIEKKLKRHGKTNSVGKSFAVVKFSRDGFTFDIAAPRRDSKRDEESHSHKNFIIDCGPHIKLEEDLRRRDFTCNSIAMRLADNSIVDPYHGVEAIKQKRIAMTGPETFSDDPLRILRAARFASVHGFAIAEDIYECAKAIILDELSKERITGELFRLLLESPQPSWGLEEYLKLTVLEKMFPPLYALSLTIQDALFHPETDAYGHHTVWAHTLIAMDIAKKLCALHHLDEEQSLTLLLAVLLHDVGKPITTKWEFKRGRMTITSLFHDSRGVEIAENFLSDLKIETRNHFPIKKTILNLVKYHHRVYELFRNRDEISFKAFSRLIKDLENQELLLLLLDVADRRSREPNPMDIASTDEILQWFMEQKQAYNLSMDTIQPLVMGRDLLNMGIPPGVKMGQYLKQLYEKQLDGEFTDKDQGLELFKKIQLEI